MQHFAGKFEAERHAKLIINSKDVTAATLVNLAHAKLITCLMYGRLAKSVQEPFTSLTF
jgi:hypothetical protein